MIPILYSADERNFDSNGLGRLYSCTACTVTEEKNGEYVCDFEMPATAEHFEDVIPGNIIFVTHDDSGIGQPFDIVSYNRPLSGVVTFRAVHVSYRLSHMVTSASGIKTITDAVNAFAAAQSDETGAPFTFENYVPDGGLIAAFDGKPHTIREILGGIEGSILDSRRCVYEWDNFTVKIRPRSGENARGIPRDFTVRYGVNLAEFQDDADYSGAYDAVVPFWTGTGTGDQEITHIAGIVENGLPRYAGRRKVGILDLTDQYENDPTTATMQAAARSYLESSRPDQPQQTIAISFVRNPDAPELQQCNLCDTIRVAYPYGDRIGAFEVVRTVYDVLRDRYTEMTLGTAPLSLSQALGVSK